LELGRAGSGGERGGEAGPSLSSCLRESTRTIQWGFPQENRGGGVGASRPVSFTQKGGRRTHKVKMIWLNWKMRSRSEVSFSSSWEKRAGRGGKYRFGRRRGRMRSLLNCRILLWTGVKELKRDQHQGGLWALWMVGDLFEDG